MRIANNIMAMNTHRVYSINNTNISKSIEKLSSGYRINRAGDDAAGLAISEKMRAQIRGLQMASKNSQDGISMVQTAEGALQTTHDILQRMREIAVQSASDTNETTIDRAALQKEFAALMEEIDDTASKTAFNDQKLIDGTFQSKLKSLSDAATGFASVTKDADGNIDKAHTNVTASYAAEAGTYTFAASNTATTTTVGGADAVAAGATPWTDDVSVSSVEFTVNPDVANWVYDMADAGSYNVKVETAQDGNNITFNLTIAGEGSTEIKGSTILNADNITDAAAAQTIDVDFGFGITAKVNIEAKEGRTADELATAIAAAVGSINESVEFTEASAGTDEVDALAPTITATAGGSPAGANTELSGISLTADASVGATFNGETIAAGDLTVATTDGSDAVFTLEIGGKTYTSASTNLLTSLNGATSTTIDLTNDDGSKFTLELTSGNQFVYHTDLSTEIGAYAATVGTDGVDYELPTGGTYTGTVSTAPAIYRSDFAVGADVDAGSVFNQEYTVTASGTQASDLTITVAGADADGAATSVTAEISEATLKGALATGKLEVNLGGSIGTIELTIDTTQFADTDELAVALVDYFGDVDNAKTIAYAEGTDGVAGTPTTTYSDPKITVTNADGTTEDIDLKVGMSSITTKSGITIDFGKELTDDDLADMDALEEFLGDLTATVTVEETAGKDFVVQTGANEGDELSINIDAMNSWTLGIDKSNISTREAASKAITAVNDAINQVSMQRADLGALQNRLEFKIQNLDISAENLQSAESRIRDLDMAAEMTTFTRNNILAQAATAMLAQANSLPQGVLQLLG